MFHTQFVKVFFLLKKAKTLLSYTCRCFLFLKAQTTHLSHWPKFKWCLTRTSKSNITFVKSCIVNSILFSKGSSNSSFASVKLFFKSPFSLDNLLRIWPVCKLNLIPSFIPPKHERLVFFLSHWSHQSSSNYTCHACSVSTALPLLVPPVFKGTIK